MGFQDCQRHGGALCYVKPVIRFLASKRPGDIQHLKAVFEEEGIACEIRNEVVSAIAGLVPLSETTPELWIEEEEVEKARAISVTLARTSPDLTRGNWTCVNCGEVNEPQFDACWQCSAPERENPWLRVSAPCQRSRA